MNKKSTVLFICYLMFTVLLFAQEKADQAEQSRLNTIKYGTETEIANLIQSLKNEGADYLDNEIIGMAQNTRNNKILTGAFAFFGEREKKGMEARALRAIEEFDEENKDTVAAAIDYIGKIKYAPAYAALTKLLEEEDKRFANGIFRSLGKISGPESGQSNDAALFLIDYYDNRDPGDENRRDIIASLGETGSSAAVDFLCGIADDSDGRAALRMAALGAIAKIANPAGLESILACIGSTDPNIRSTAVGSLGPFSGDAVDDAILDAFRDSYYRTRIAAAQASRQRKLAKAAPFLRQRAENDEVPNVREEAIKALGAIANAEANSILEDLFTERKNSVRVRIAAGEMLMENEPSKHLDAFIKEIDYAKEKNQTALYNGLLKIIGQTKCPGMENFTRRLIQQNGIAEKTYALDIAANNRLTSLSSEIKALASDKNESLARRARRTMETLGIQ